MSSAGSSHCSLSENADNIEMIAGALREACDEVESISGTEPDVE